MKCHTVPWQADPVPNQDMCTFNNTEPSTRVSRVETHFRMESGDAGSILQWALLLGDRTQSWLQGRDPSWLVLQQAARASHVEGLEGQWASLLGRRVPEPTCAPALIGCPRPQQGAVPTSQAVWWPLRSCEESCGRAQEEAELTG